MLKFEKTFPKFTETSNSILYGKLKYGFDDMIDLLTSIDPQKRPSAKESIEMLNKIKANFQQDR